MMSKQNVPELRFPEFSGEWEDDLFGSIVSNKSEKYAPNENEEVIDIELDSIESNTGRLLHTYDSRTQKSQKNRFNEGDVLYSKLRPYLNKFYWPDFPGVCTLEIWVFSSKNDDKLKNQFIYYFIQTSRFGNMANKSAGSKMPRADWKLVENIKFSYPKVEEQHKISDLLIKLDRLIELEVKKLELLEEQKKGYMQKIFSQELKFKDEKGNDYPDWKRKKIKDIGEVVTGNTPSKNKEDYWNSDDYVWVTPSDINNNKNIKTTETYLSEKGYEKARKLPKGTLLVTCIASIGKNVILDEIGSCNQQINAVIPGKNFDIDFLYYRFEEVSKYMKLIAGKTATQIMNKSSFESLYLDLPIYEEQVKIGEFLSRIDTKMQFHMTKITYLNKYKQGLMQKMYV